MCIGGVCIPIPAAPSFPPGYRCADATKCASGKLSGKYCAGLAKGDTCDDTTVAKRCDVGLYCDTDKKCQTMLADAASCKAGQCQPNSLCYPDNLCHKWHFLENGKPAPDAKMCQSAYTLSGNCAAKPTVEKDFFDNATESSTACKYSDNAPWPGMCIMYSKDPKQAGYCISFSKIPMTKYMDYVNKFAAGSCASNDPTCDKAADAYGCPAFKDMMKEYAYMLTYPETMYPDCEEKIMTKTLDDYKCFAKELIWGFITVLAIVLMI